MRLLLTTLLWLAPVLVAQAQVSKGFDHFYNLEYDESVSVFEKVLAEDPKDPRNHNHLAQAILYREMYRAGALESELVSGTNPFVRRPKMEPSPENQKRFEDAVRNSILLSQARLEANPLDKDALYAMGVAYGLRGNYNFLVRKAYMDALRDATQARKLHNKVTEIDPSFVDARLVQGIHDYIVGSLPLFYKIVGFLVGFRGDREGGIRTVELVAEKGAINRDDAKVLLAAVYRRERRPQAAIPLLLELIPRYPRNYLLRLELVQMYSDDGKKARALEVLSELEQLKLSNASNYARLPTEKIHFSRGNLLFWYRDLDEAMAEFKRVTDNPESVDLNSEAVALLRMGQIHDLKRRRDQALRSYRQAIQLAPESDAAREARRYLDSPYKRKDIPS